MKELKVAVVGATGLVGEYVLKLLQERDFPVAELKLYASAQSKGKKLPWKKKKIKVEDAENILSFAPDLAFFATSPDISKQYIPSLTEKGTFVIDKSRAFRLMKNVPLVIPEINSHLLNKNTRLVASPNCTTIQLVMTIAPILKLSGITKLVATTMQSISGAGREVLNSFQSGKSEPDITPAIGKVEDLGYCEEEISIYNETRKIFQRLTRMAVTTVRVPVPYAHSISIWVKTLREININGLESSYENFPGIVYLKKELPTCQLAAGRDEIFVGRLRHDHLDPRALLLFSTCDNLRKGAATNAVQIAEVAISKGLL